MDNEGLLEALVSQIPTQKILLDTDGRFGAVLAFIRVLEKSEVDERWYRSIFKALLLETYHGYVNVAGGWNTGDVRRLAWGVRSLMELRLWTDYVIASRDNAKQLDREFDIDRHQPWKLFEPFLQVSSVEATFEQLIPELCAEPSTHAD